MDNEEYQKLKTVHNKHAIGDLLNDEELDFYIDKLTILTENLAPLGIAYSHTFSNLIHKLQQCRDYKAAREHFGVKYP